MESPWKPFAVDITTDSKTVTGTAALVKGIYINTTFSAHTVNISNGSTVVFIIPASSSAGTVIDFGGEAGVLFDTNVIVDPDDSATAGNLTILYKNKA